MKLSQFLLAGALSIGVAQGALAHTEDGPALKGPYFEPRMRIHRRAKIIPRAQQTNAAQMAKVSSSKEQCKWYELPQTEKLNSLYPKDGKIATIVDGDEQAQQVWKDIQDSNIIPQHVKPKAGTPDHMGFAHTAMKQYDSDSDPDCWWSATKCTEPKSKKISEDLVTCPEPSTWGLTFDDGPNCTHNAFYDFLKEQNLKATFFYIGLNVKNWPLQAQRGLADGHDICVHTWSHHYMTTLTDEQVFAELFYTMRIIKDVVGVTPRCWRPPFGDVDDRVRAIADGLGLRTILWSDDTNDWDLEPEGSSSKSEIERNYQRIIKKGEKGKSVVVLTHEIREDTMDIFMNMYPKIKKAFKHVVPLSACMNATHPYVENKISYKHFSDFVNGETTAKGLPSAAHMKIHPKSELEITPISDQKNDGFAGK